jgi:crotonobetainyl-CoA:carnitine CoA-transferase CaiB-like acyl-CoA transferase
VDARLARRADVDAIVGGWAATVTADEAQERLRAIGVPVGVIQDAGDLMDDPQLVARDMWHRIDHGVFGIRPYDRFPALWSGMDLHPYVPPPSYVGEHNFEVYVELAGLDEVEVAEGMADGLFS